MAAASIPLAWLIETGRQMTLPAQPTPIRNEDATAEMSIAWRKGAASAIRASGSWCPDTQYAIKALLLSDANRLAFRVGCVGPSGEVKEYTLFVDRIVQTARLAAS